MASYLSVSDWLLVTYATRGSVCQLVNYRLTQPVMRGNLLQQHFFGCPIRQLRLGLEKQVLIMVTPSLRAFVPAVKLCCRRLGQPSLEPLLPRFWCADWQRGRAAYRFNYSLAGHLTDLPESVGH